MTVSQQPDGKFAVVDATGIVLAGPFDANSEAWRWIDRHENEPVSRAESVAEWLFHQSTKD